MKIALIDRIADGVIRAFNTLWSTINQTPAGGKFGKVRETPVNRPRPWEGKWVPREKKGDRVKSQAHAKGSPNTDTKTFNHPRR